MIYKDTLIKIGLNEGEAKIYETLLQEGAMPVVLLSKKIGLTRTNTYNLLSSLAKKGLVESFEKKKKLCFRIESPTNLNKLLKEKDQSVEQIKKTLANIMPSIESDYRLITEKPTIQFFEGIEGVKKVIQDTLTAKNEVCTYIDVKAVHHYIPKINVEQKMKRKTIGLKKRLICVDSPYARERAKLRDPKLTETRLIRGKISDFEAVMNIYDNKVSYITLSKKSFLGIIIEDPRITKMHQILFNYIWSNATP